jgi:DNA primase
MRTVASRRRGRPPGSQSYTVAGVAVSHPDKLWWPDERITKLDVVRYYDDVEPRLRSWMKDRLLTAERCPDGMRGSCPVDFNLRSIERRLAAEDPWHDFWRRRQRLPRVPARSAERHAA